MAETKLKGIPASQGIAAGPTFLLLQQDQKVDRFHVEDSEAEVGRLTEAIVKARIEIEQLG
ncbi:MAG: phosphoenolpyruvate-utilizing N-terminal domain-containing protein [Anaerolineales bacterium]